MWYDFPNSKSFKCGFFRLMLYETASKPENKSDCLIADKSLLKGFKINTLFSLLSGNIQDLVLIMKESYYFRDDYYKKYGDIYDSIPYLFAFHLASDSKFEVLVNDFKVSIKDSSKPLLEEEFLAFVKFLREEVKPLV